MVYFASKFLYIQKIFGGANSFFVYQFNVFYHICIISVTGVWYCKVLLLFRVPLLISVLAVAYIGLGPPDA